MIWLGLLLIGSALFSLRSSLSAPVSRKQLLSRLEPYMDRDENLSPIERILERAELDAAKRKGRRRNDLFPMVSKWIASSRIGLLNNLSADLSRIGSNWRPSEVIYAGAAMAALVFLLVALIMKMFWLGLGLAVLVMGVPFAIVRVYAKRWTIRFENQLADTLLLMANATQAGYGFQQAMEMVAREGLPPMSSEFQRMSQEVRLGVPIAEALNHMAERVQNRDLMLTVTAIIIAMEVGGALSEILRSISETIRDRVRIRGEINILSTQGRFTGVILALMPIGMGIMISIFTRTKDQKPDEVYLYPLFNGQRYKWGPRLIMTGIVMNIVGFLVIQRIVNIEI